MNEKVLHTPEGVRDIYNIECEKKRKVEASLSQVMKEYGFKGIETPTFEYFDVFSEERGTVSSKNMYKFFDREGNTLVLRPDITPAIARCIAKYYKEETLPIRLCYLQNTYINNSSYQGKMKETTQAGAELINDSSMDADAEMIALSIDCMLRAGVSEFQMEIGQVEFFRSLVEEAELTKDQENELRLCIEEKNLVAVEELLKEKEIKEELKEIFLELPQMFGSLEKILKVKEKTHNQKAKKAIERLERIYEMISMYGLERYITFDLGMLSKYNYYTGIIFRAFTYGTGEAILGGGRYDTLVGQFGKEAPAIGMAMNVDQLILALTRQKIVLTTKAENTLIVYRESERFWAIRLAKQFRGEHLFVELYCTKEDIDQQKLFEYASEHQIGGFLILKDANSIQVLHTQAKTVQETTIQQLLEET